ncbi:MAG TPA: type VI secretion system tip protein VgrG [Vicinamibacterales bacterium]|nr:type VI secretion system tip protein VgrG [Vicinamibacterales bacterium]
MATRALPIPATHRGFTVKAAGAEVPRQHQLLAATVVKTVNRVSSARLVYLDGSASAGKFPLADDALFVPGQEIEVLAGPAGSPVSIFAGVVVRQSVKVRDASAPQLIVECRHKAAKLTVGRKNAYYMDQSDSDIVSALLGDAGLSASVESTPLKHKQQVQYRSTDWDFLLARARANGKLVLTNDGTVAVKAPTTSTTPSVTLQFGATVLELDAEIDARVQFAGVKGISWDPAQQSLVESDASAPRVATPGNLTSDDLAAVVGLPSYDLRHAAIVEDEAKAWADAEWLHSAMSKVSGRAKCEGVATVNPGDVVSLAGVGERYNGTAFVTGVRHDFDLVSGWKTNVQFGGLSSSPSEDPDRTAPQAGDLLPAVHGMQVGVVTSNEDPDGEHRVRVRLPLVDNDEDGVWARVASLDAGADRGFFFRPEIGDEVVVGFFDDDPRRPVMLGMLHSSANAAPLSGSNDNHEKVYQSRSKLKLSFNDDTKVIEISTPAGNTLTLSEADTAITIADQNSNTLKMTPDGITVESSKALTLKAGTTLLLESGTSFSMKGGSAVKVEASGSAELSSSGTTTIKGSLVRIN